MSIKSTTVISREHALMILVREIAVLPNDILADLLDLIADSDRGQMLSRFDNFIVSGAATEEA